MYKGFLIMRHTVYLALKGRNQTDKDSKSELITFFLKKERSDQIGRLSA